MQNNEIINVLFIGDIIGKTGRSVIKQHLKRIKEENNIHFTIANGENLAGGFGLTKKIATNMFNAGIDVLTAGNHIWDNNDIMNIIDDNRIIRPLNYHPDLPGKGYTNFKIQDTDITIINLAGRIFMQPLDCPFRTIDTLLKKIGKNRISIIDFHSEASAEKQAFGNYVDGKITAVLGTHTHVQTADERILPEGTAYITDAGMTGALDGVIGFNKEKSIEKIIYQVPKRLAIATELPVFNGVILNIDKHSKKAKSIKRIFEYV